MPLHLLQIVLVYEPLEFNINYFYVTQRSSIHIFQQIQRLTGLFSKPEAIKELQESTGESNDLNALQERGREEEDETDGEAQVFVICTTATDHINGFFPSLTSVKRESCCRPEKSLSP